MNLIERQAKEVRKLAAKLHKDEEVTSMDLGIDKAYRILDFEYPVLLEAHRQNRAEQYEFEMAFSTARA